MNSRIGSFLAREAWSNWWIEDDNPTLSLTTWNKQCFAHPLINSDLGLDRKTTFTTKCLLLC